MESTRDIFPKFNFFHNLATGILDDHIRMIHLMRFPIQSASFFPVADRLTAVCGPFPGCDILLKLDLLISSASTNFGDSERGCL